MSLAIDALAESVLRSGNTPALWVLVNRGDGTVHCRGYGVACLESGAAAHERSSFQLASIGKMFVASLAVILERDGAFDLDAPVAGSLGLVADPWPNVTMRHLLSHTGGVTDYFFDDGASKFDLARDCTEQELIDQMVGLGFDFAPGADVKYSNAGYLLAGIALGRVAGRPYWQELERRIFAPLGMPATRLIAPDDVFPDRANSYERRGDAFVPHPAVSRTYLSTADGSHWSTAADFAWWDLALRNNAILTAREYARLTQPSPQSIAAGRPRGMGFHIDAVNGRTLIGHSGEFQGFLGEYQRSVEDDIGVAVFVNANAVDTGALIGEVWQRIWES